MILHQQLSGESSISTDPESNDLSEDSLQQVEIIAIIAMNHDVLEHSTQIASKSCPFTSIDVAFSSLPDLTQNRNAILLISFSKTKSDLHHQYQPVIFHPASGIWCKTGSKETDGQVKKSRIQNPLQFNLLERRVISSRDIQLACSFLRESPGLD